MRYVRCVNQRANVIESVRCLYDLTCNCAMYKRVQYLEYVMYSQTRAISNIVDVSSLERNLVMLVARYAIPSEVDLSRPFVWRIP